ncbi:MAG: hypothetical protein H7A21_10585 [Spirochaetales bacterium]|nr:hypothetical protein [Leptospiraceae bacterium]MCP5481869.1 hypothetical protein [Spirochaetales bacterium]MCP5486324.1 hypothetical protein [Spirochaetales bacterium]
MSAESPVVVGELRKLNRPTFLLNGIFVLQGSTVEVRAVRPDGLVEIEYRDREGNPHILTDIKPDELV